MPSARQGAALLPAGSLTEKGGVLGGSRICRILPRDIIRKCGENPRFADQTPVLTFSDLRFCWQKSGCAQRFSIFPRTSEKRDEAKRPKAESTIRDLFKEQPLNAKTAFRRLPRTKPDVPSQGLFTVATLRKSPILVNPLPRKAQRL